ncbi:CBS domain-containing protein [Actinorugispora endophytica]|uniref:CBS domain protein n=1 Tax=Actinorugispora endophytica TaxID=1605990 RepID=A0A4R6UWA8_9ACTN|nr:CBS domain-containing protein [Actinorugispora endophytica]TDQ51572.1 CBS domain protein [Actinorugispora endophytica]
MAQKIRDVMTARPRTIPPTATLRDAAALMRDSDVGDVIVAENDKPVGILTDRDIVVRCVAQGGAPDVERVDSVSSSRVVSVSPDADITEAARIMREKSVRRLPVVEGDTIVGVVSIGDLAIERDPRSALADISAARPNE